MGIFEGVEAQASYYDGVGDEVFIVWYVVRRTGYLESFILYK